jgi:hypothetical protein
MKSWNELKQQGSTHYKTGDVEPIDLYKSGDMLHDFALASIIKYAFRSRRSEGADKVTVIKNLKKIIHYAELILTTIVVENTAVNVRTLTDG